MRCDETSSHLVAYLHHELADNHARAVADHLGGCPACRDELEASRQVMRGLRRMELREPPASLITGTIKAAGLAATAPVPRRLEIPAPPPHMRGAEASPTQLNAAAHREAAAEWRGPSAAARLAGARWRKRLILALIGILLGAAATLVAGKYLRKPNPIAEQVALANARELLRHKPTTTTQELLAGAGWKVDLGGLGQLAVLPQQNPATGEAFLALYRTADVAYYMNGRHIGDFFKSLLAKAERINPQSGQYALPEEMARQVFGSEQRLTLVNIPGRRLELWAASEYQNYLNRRHDPAKPDEPISGPTVPGVPED